MSLLDAGPDEAVVYPAGPALPDGGHGPEGEPVTVRCRIQPSTEAASGAEGWTDVTEYRMLARRLPAGPWSRVRWDGRDWTIAEQPKKWRGSARISHDTALIRRR